MTTAEAGKAVVPKPLAAKARVARRAARELATSHKVLEQQEQHPRSCWSQKRKMFLRMRVTVSALRRALEYQRQTRGSLRHSRE